MTEQCRTYKVLIIEDEQSVREILKDALQEQNIWHVEEADFDQVENLLRTFRPDMVVLDLIIGTAQEGDYFGNETFEKIREIWFCPVVVYSAAIDRKNFEHPLVEVVQKGSGSEQKVIKYLKKFTFIAQEICSTHSKFDQEVREALYDSARHLPDDSYLTDGSDVLRRNVRRLVAARTDIESENVRLKAWERFVIPPLGQHLLTADLLRRRDKNWKDEEAFRLVLTPSCDMVKREEKPAKADHILVACCEPIYKLGNIYLNSGKDINRKQKERLKSILTQGMTDLHIPIPELEGCVPLMVANLKQLDLISWDQLCSYDRVASTDSPFREMVVWAYLRVSGRPGLPEVDIDNWMDDISRWIKEA